MSKQIKQTKKKNVAWLIGHKMIELTTLHADDLQVLCHTIFQHKQKTEILLQSSGYVVPTHQFFEGELKRYQSIFSHLIPSFYNSRVATIREVLQNSTDAHTDVLKIDFHDFHDHLNIPATLNAHAYFVSFADTGQWTTTTTTTTTTTGVENPTTYDICCQYFLQMNGSYKTHSNKNNCLKDQDGGFGIGRFIILFCAPMWFMTVKNMLLLGTYNCYQILCRACQRPLQSSCCNHCLLRESDVDNGTTIMVNYSFLDSAAQCQLYKSTMINEYLKYCQVSFPVFVSGQQVHSYSCHSDIIAQTQHMKVQQYQVEEENDSNYFIRSHNGVVMFSVNLYNPNSVSGRYVIQLPPHVNYKDFDQSRQTLIHEPGQDLKKFLSERDGAISNTNLMFHTQHVECQGMFSYLGQELKTTTVHAPLSCVYLFSGSSVGDIQPAKWRPGYHRHSTYLLLLWSKLIFRCIDEGDLDVLMSVSKKDDVRFGFVLDSETAACKKGHTFYLNPVLLEKHVGKIMKKNYLRILSYMIPLAVHEVCHYQSSQHDEMFASAVNKVSQNVWLFYLHCAKRRLLKNSCWPTSVELHSQFTQHVQPSRKRKKTSGNPKKDVKRQKTTL